MNKPQIKNFSVWARRKLIETVSYRMSLIGIFENRIAEALPQSTANLKFYDIGTSKPAEVKGDDIGYRSKLVSKIERDGYKSTVDEIAYTWFNRLIAIRFMEVNDYLPSRVRVLSSLDSEKNEPDIVTEAVSVADENGFDISADEIYRLKDENKADELFGKMFEFQCIQLYSCLPELFQNSENYMEMLLPVSYTDKDGIIYHLVHDIPEDDFNLEKEGQVEIIGWLYQYYNTEPKDAVFADLKKNIKISKEKIPAATQLFTPDWIVRYMVENSLGRLWLDGHSDCSAKSEWKYYLEEAEQEESVRAQLDEIRKEYRALNPEQIKFIDPCMGSGHILIYAFEVLMQIYTSCGYSERDAAQLIVNKNLYGLDIDQRAYQLAYFSLMMKARQYDRRFLTRNIKPNLAHFQGLASVRNAYVTGAIKEFAEQFENCDIYGSLTVFSDKWAVDSGAADNLQLIPDDFCGVIGMEFDKIERMMTIYKALTQKYDVVCTNPPYMGGSGMSAALSDFVKKHYPDSKSDLFAVFIERCGELAKANGFYAMITQHAFMFLSSYEKLREKLLHKTTVNMAHLGARAFDEIGGEVVQTTAFVNYNSHIKDYKGTYARLVDVNGENEKKEKFLSGDCLYTAKQENFSKIPGAPVAYWVSENFVRAFENGECLGKICEARKGLATSDNNRFLKLWFEVAINNICFSCQSNEESCNIKQKWFPHNKGGEFHRWYGNNEYVINWYHDGFEIRNYRDDNGKLLSRPQNTNYNFKNALTWSKITSGTFSSRYCDGGFLFDDAAAICYSDDKSKLKYVLGFLNSSIAQYMLDILNPTLNKQISDMSNLVILLDEEKIDRINNFVEQNIFISKSDWDSFETSWDFKKHPLVSVISDQLPVTGTDHYPLTTDNSTLTTDNSKTTDHYPLTTEHYYKEWEKECNDRFNTLKHNEEELNRIFIDIYGLQDELTPEVEDKDVTVRKADLQREIKSLVSYAVGCMFGRYSLDREGLAYAGGDFSEQWAAVSGQLFKREVVEYYVGKELSRVDSMAEIYGFGGDSLQPCETAAENGDVCIVGSVEKGSGFDPFKYRRGTAKKLYQGIRELSVNSKRIKCGSGNTAYDLCSPEILDAISNGNGNELVSRGWKDAELIDWKAIHSKLTTDHFSPDKDNCIPITDDNYFGEDDIVKKFADFIKAVYGEETLEENLNFIAEALGNRGNTSREVIRNYFLNDFYKDHLKTYQKRPIYWLFDSGKQNGFKALVYMHRWNADTIGNVRVEYLHKTQKIYMNELDRMQDTIDNSNDAREIAAAKKAKEKLTKQLKETKDYDASMAHLANMRIDIDLDDGVKVNYEKVQTDSEGKNLGILAKI